MKVLLIYTNRNHYLAPPPVGLSYLIPPLLKNGHQVKVLDLMFAKNPNRELEKTIAAYHPDLAGFSIRNLDNQSMLGLKNPLAEIKEFVAIARNKKVITILGGTAFTTFPREMLQFMQADYGIAGQGEESLPSLVDGLANHQLKSDIPGLVYKDGDTITANLPRITGYTGNLNTDWSLIDMKRYKRNALLTPAATVVIKTGCPYNCSFCDSRTTMGNRFIFCNIDQVIEEIKNLKKLYGMRWFFLNGLCFNSPLNNAKQLLQRIIGANLQIRFMTRLYPIRNAFDDEFFELYKKAGGYFTMIDFNSFSDTMLRNYNKPFNVEDIYHFGEMAAKHGLKFGAELLFGGPGETHETIRESMAFLPHINYSLLQYAIGLRISPYTGLFEIAKREGLIDDADSLLFSKFYISKAVDVQWARNYIGRATRKYAYRNARMAPMIFHNFRERF
jgi:Fe-S oxidoreductase